MVQGMDAKLKTKTHCCDFTVEVLYWLTLLCFLAIDGIHMTSQLSGYKPSVVLCVKQFIHKHCTHPVCTESITSTLR